MTYRTKPASVASRLLGLPRVSLGIFKRKKKANKTTKRERCPTLRPPPVTQSNDSVGAAPRRLVPLARAMADLRRAQVANAIVIDTAQYLTLNRAIVRRDVRGDMVAYLIALCAHVGLPDAHLFHAVYILDAYLSRATVEDAKDYHAHTILCVAAVRAAAGTSGHVALDAYIAQHVRDRTGLLNIQMRLYAVLPTRVFRASEDVALAVPYGRLLDEAIDCVVGSTDTMQAKFTRYLQLLALFQFSALKVPADVLAAATAMVAAHMVHRGLRWDGAMETCVGRTEAELWGVVEFVQALVRQDDQMPVVKKWVFARKPAANTERSGERYQLGCGKKCVGATHSDDEVEIGPSRNKI